MIYNKDYVLVLIGQIISMFGNVMFRFCISLYLLDVTKSVSIFGTIMAISLIPTIIISPIGGIIADRINRRNIMVFLDFSTCGVILIYGFFINNSMVNITTITGILLVLLSIIQAIYQPAVNSSIPLLQKKDNIIKANAIVNQVLTLSGLLGPVLGGILYGIIDFKILIIISASCFFTSAVLERFINIPKVTSNTTEYSILKVFKEDFIYSVKYVFKERPNTFKFLLSVGIYASIVNGICIIGLPYLIRIKLNMSSQLYGLAEAAIAAAGILGGIVLSIYGDKIRAEKVYIFLAIAGIILLPLTITSLVDIGNIYNYAAIVVCFMGIQFVATIFSVYIMSMLQKNVPITLIGKISAYFTTVIMISQPIGQGLYGALFGLSQNKVYLVIATTSVTLILLSLYIKKNSANVELYYDIHSD